MGWTWGTHGDKITGVWGPGVPDDTCSCLIPLNSTKSTLKDTLCLPSLRSGAYSVESFAHICHPVPLFNPATRMTLDIFMLIFAPGV